MHSTGIIIGKGVTSKKMRKKGFTNHQYVWTKELGPSVPLVYTERVNKHLVAQVKPFLFAVHTRHATFGKITVPNAHPFEIGTIIGMHNGTSPSFSPMKDTREVTDSQLIYEHLYEYGVEATIKKMDNKDAYALVWLDRSNDTINFLRNHQRSLYVAANKSKTTMFWASERSMLVYALNKCGLNNFDIDAVDPNRWTAIELTTMNVVKSEAMSPWPKYTPPPPVKKIEVIGPDKKKEEKDPTFPFLKPDTSVPVVPQGEYVKGVKPLMRYYPYEENGVATQHVMVELYADRMISLVEFNRRVKQGCAMCDHIPTAGEVIRREEELHWFNKDEYVCNSCHEELTGHLGLEVKPQPRDRPELEQKRTN